MQHALFHRGRDAPQPAAVARVHECHAAVGAAHEREGRATRRVMDGAAAVERDSHPLHEQIECRAHHHAGDLWRRQRCGRVGRPRARACVLLTHRAHDGAISLGRSRRRRRGRARWRRLILFVPSWPGTRYLDLPDRELEARGHGRLGRWRRHVAQGGGDVLQVVRHQARRMPERGAIEAGHLARASRLVAQPEPADALEGGHLDLVD